MNPAAVQPDAYRRIKIAVLDTGFNPNDPFAPQLHWEDFVIDGSQLRVDETGHGTNSARLILQICPEADLYVARIFQTNIADDSFDAGRMAKVSLCQTSWLLLLISLGDSMGC